MLATPRHVGSPSLSTPTKAERLEPFDRVRGDRLDVGRGGEACGGEARVAEQQHAAHLVVD
jgi:hypothetical protein